MSSFTAGYVFLTAGYVFFRRWLCFQRQIKKSLGKQTVTTTHLLSAGCGDG